MSNPAKKLWSEMVEAVLDGTEILQVELDGKKKKVTGFPSGGLSWLVKSGAYTLGVNEAVLADLSTGDITLPASMAIGDQVAVKNVNAVALNVADNGKTIRHKGTDYTMDVTLLQGDTMYLTAFSTTIWEVT